MTGIDDLKERMADNMRSAHTSGDTVSSPHDAATYGLEAIRAYLAERGVLLGPDGLVKAEPTQAELCTVHVPDDLTARLRSNAWYRRANGDDRLQAEAADRIDALSDDVARLTAERDGLATTLVYWKNLLTTRTATLYERAERAEAYRDEARALVAERDATIERLRKHNGWLREAIEDVVKVWRSTPDRVRQGGVIDHAQAVLADTAPTPETHNG